jgi:hypothetical protein
VVDVYLTVDTECSMGGAWKDPSLSPVVPERAILGKIGGQYYGIPLLMEIMEQNGLQGTFFLEVLASRLVGESTLQDIYGTIVQRGHDVQLHLHPVYHYFHLVRQGLLRPAQLPPTMDLIGSLPIDVQLELLEMGCSIFGRLLGQAPIAFRAGCYGASLSTLLALEKVGIRYDSSFNAMYLGSTCLIDYKGGTNTPWQVGKVWEVPVTSFETGAWKMRGFKGMEVSAVSLWEMKHLLERALRLSMKTVVIIVHSFSLLKIRDLQFREIRPDLLVIKRFEGLCEFLRKRCDDFQVVTFSDHPQFRVGSQRIQTPNMGTVVPVLRKLIQGVNRFYWV